MQTLYIAHLGYSICPHRNNNTKINSYNSDYPFILFVYPKALTLTEGDKHVITELFVCFHFFLNNASLHNIAVLRINRSKGSRLIPLDLRIFPLLTDPIH